MAQELDIPIIDQYYFGLSKYAPRGAVDVAYAKSRSFLLGFLRPDVSDRNSELAKEALKKLEKIYPEIIKETPPVVAIPAAYDRYFPLADMASREHLPLLSVYFLGIQAGATGREIDEAYNQKLQEFQYYPESEAVSLARQAVEKAYQYLHSCDEYQKLINEPERYLVSASLAAASVPIGIPAAFYEYFPLINTSSLAHLSFFPEYFLDLKEVTSAREIDVAYNQKIQELQSYQASDTIRLALEAVDRAYRCLKSQDEYQRFIKDTIPGSTWLETSSAASAASAATP